VVGTVNLTVVKSYEASSVRSDCPIASCVVHGPFKWFELAEVSLCFHAVMCTFVYVCVVNGLSSLRYLCVSMLLCAHLYMYVWSFLCVLHN